MTHPTERNARYAVIAAWIALILVVSLETVAGAAGMPIPPDGLRGLGVAVAVTLTLSRHIEAQTAVLRQMRAEQIELVSLGEQIGAGRRQAALLHGPRRVPPARYDHSTHGWVG